MPFRAAPSSEAVVLCECFARDGLQHEAVFMPTGQKVALIDRFSALGFGRIEATSFTHPGNVPQFNDADAVLAGIVRRPGTRYKATCINQRSIERALAAAQGGHGPDEISVVLVASEALLFKAFKRSTSEQYQTVATMIDAARGRFGIVGTISSALGCPLQGVIAQQTVIGQARWLAGQGVRQIAIADTTGMGDPRRVRALFEALREAVPEVVPIAHFHDTRGMGLANCLAAYEAGVRHFDCAFGGTGGNPARAQYADGHSGNVCTEDLVTLFESMGIPTGLRLDELLPLALACEQALGRVLHGRVTRAGLGLLTSGETHV